MSITSNPTEGNFCCLRLYKVQEDGASSAADNTGLNVETSPENNLDTPIETINVALNVEMDINTKKDGPVTGLNVETSPNDNTK